MSIKVMSLVFDYQFKPASVSVTRKGAMVKKNVSPASQKLVMLALADHSNDEGEGAYPSLTTITQKTNLTRPTVSITLRCLKEQGLLYRVGFSKRNTANYTINISETGLLSKPAGGLPSKPGVVYSVNPNHPVNRPLGARSARGASAPPPPAICAFREAAKAYPSKSQWPAIVEAVGEEAAALDLWRQVVEGYVLLGWNPRNVAGMLDFFKRGEVPRPKSNGRAAGDPWAGVDVHELNRKLAAGEI